MKKFTVFAAAVALCCLAGNVQAQRTGIPASASTDVFDFTPWNDDKLLELFANAADEGRKYPTKEEFEAAGFNLDLEFSRSHVRPAAIMEDAAKNIGRRCVSYTSVMDEYPYGTRRSYWWLSQCRVQQRCVLHVELYQFVRRMESQHFAGSRFLGGCCTQKWNAHVLGY